LSPAKLTILRLLKTQVKLSNSKIIKDVFPPLLRLLKTQVKLSNSKLVKNVFSPLLARSSDKKLADTADRQTEAQNSESGG
jgi:hypothetical protein